jgi:dTDP-4-amino-4,6-dideoxygalactose transaminase
MHTFGHPARIEAIARVCRQWRIPLVEDAAESLGSLSGDRHTGLFGQAGILSFNGNKTITTGGGGMLITDDETVGRLAKHLSTTARQPHPYEYVHDAVGFNYRLPNLNAALGCAQMEQLPRLLALKRELAQRYRVFFAGLGVPFVVEPPGAHSNYWLNAILLAGRQERDAFLDAAVAAGVLCRPVWELMTQLPMYAACRRGDGLANAYWLADRVVSIPSWPIRGAGGSAI